MKQIFAKTKNAEEFMAAVEAVRQADPGHRMGLAYGPPGTGKSQAVLKICLDRGYPYVRAKQHTTTKSLLKSIARELGIPNSGAADAIYTEIVDHLKTTPGSVLFVDEADYLAKNDKVLTLMDIHDESQCPVILVGMQTVKIKLQRYPHMLDRCSAVVEFEEFKLEDIKSLGKQLCEVGLDDSASQYIFEKGRGRFRRTKVLFARAERTGKTNRLKTVTGAHLKKMEKGKKR